MNTNEVDSLSIATNIEWTDSEEILVKELGEKMILNRQLCSIAYEKYNKMLIGFSVSVSIITGITGLLSFATDKIPTTFTYWSIIVGIVSFIATTISGISQVLKIADKVGRFKYLENSWSNTARDVQITLALKRNNRPNFKIFIEKIRTQYNTLITDMNDIDSAIVNYLKSTVRYDGLTTPERIGTLKPIRINVDEVQTISMNNNI